MASQVRPWLIEPKTLRGSEESVGMIRNQPAYSIRASDIESHKKAGCMAAINSCEPKQKKALGKKGRPCMKCHLCARKGILRIFFPAVVYLAGWSQPGSDLVTDLVTTCGWRFRCPDQPPG